MQKQSSQKYFSLKANILRENATKMLGNAKNVQNTIDGTTLRSKFYRN